jgi:hypothetical protein
MIKYIIQHVVFSLGDHSVEYTRNGHLVVVVRRINCVPPPSYTKAVSIEYIIFDWNCFTVSSRIVSLNDTMRDNMSQLEWTLELGHTSCGLPKAYIGYRPWKQCYKGLRRWGPIWPSDGGKNGPQKGSGGPKNGPQKKRAPLAVRFCQIRQLICNIAWKPTLSINIFKNTNSHTVAHTIRYDS